MFRSFVTIATSPIDLDIYTIPVESSTTSTTVSHFLLLACFISTNMSFSSINFPSTNSTVLGTTTIGCQTIPIPFGRNYYTPCPTLSYPLPHNASVFLNFESRSLVHSWTSNPTNTAGNGLPSPTIIFNCHGLAGVDSLPSNNITSVNRSTHCSNSSVIGNFSNSFAGETACGCLDLYHNGTAPLYGDHGSVSSDRNWTGIGKPSSIATSEPTPTDDNKLVSGASIILINTKHLKLTAILTLGVIFALGV